MAINLLALEPHKVSTDLSGYITYVYGEPKCGKTTFAAKMPDPLLVAFERGYNAIPGIVAQDVTSWGEFKQVVRELKKPEVRQRFRSVALDTVDIAAKLCEKYVCTQNDVEALGQIPYGQGWTKFKNEFEETVRTITQLGYAVVFISHVKDKEFTRKDNTKYNQSVPTCNNSANMIISAMADIYAFAEKYVDNTGTSKVRLIIRSADNSAETGCRFKYIEPVIDFTYEALEKALQDAIQKEAEMTGGMFLTDEKMENKSIAVDYDYAKEIARFNETVEVLMGKNAEYFAPRVTQIVDKYLGKGKKVSETTLDQAELIYFITEEMISSLMDVEVTTENQAE